MIRIFLAAAAITVAATATPARAEFWDVIAFKLNEGCTLQQQLAITRDFNAWGRRYGYQAKVLAPLQSDDLETYFWVGSSTNASAFGSAWEAWRSSLDKPDSEPSRLWARFQQCTTNVRRAGYDVYSPGIREGR